MPTNANGLVYVQIMPLKDASVALLFLETVRECVGGKGGGQED